jgi:hypothetical protein
VYIKKGRLELVENVIGMDKTREANKIFESKPEGTRKMGRSKWRCLEDAENDITRDGGEREITEKNGHLS